MTSWLLGGITHLHLQCTLKEEGGRVLAEGSPGLGFELETTQGREH